MEELSKKLKAKIEEEDWFPGKKLGEFLNKNKEERKESKEKKEKASLSRQNSDRDKSKEKLLQTDNSEKEKTNDSKSLKRSGSSKSPQKSRSTGDVAEATAPFGSPLNLFPAASDSNIPKSESKESLSKDPLEGSEQFIELFKKKDDKKSSESLKESSLDSSMRKIIAKLRPDGAGQEDISDVLKAPPKIIKGNVIGRLSVSIQEGKQIEYSILNPNESSAPRVPRGYYVKIRLEDQEECTDTTLKDGILKWQKNTFSFEVTDSSTDLSIFLFRKRPVKNDKLVGQVIIPLPIIYQPEEYNFNQTQWYELFPHIYGRHKYMPAIDFIDGTGLDRPKITPGFLKLQIDLKLEEQPYYTYLKSSPIVAVELEKQKLDIAILKMNAGRIRNWFSTPPIWLEGIQKILKAEIAISSLVVAWLSLFFLCFICPLWLYPILFGLFSAWLSLMSRGKTKYEDRIWKDEVQPNPNTVPQVMVKIVKLLPEIQYGLGVAASILERLTNAFNWSDPIISTMISVSVLVVSAAFSFFLLLGIHHICHVILFIGGTVFLFKPYFDKQKGAPKSDTPKSNPKVELILIYLKNFFSKVPDNLEISHRKIAARQVPKTAP